MSKNIDVKRFASHSLRCVTNKKEESIGEGSFGSVISVDELQCEKRFEENNIASFVREVFNIYLVKDISGIVEVESIYSVKKNDSRLLTSPRIYCIKMKKYKMNLSQWLKRLPPSNSRYIVSRRIIRVMQKVHSRGIIHGDLKLENIMFSFSGKLRIIDWGSGGYSGFALIKFCTDVYSSPEENSMLSHDVYSLGIVCCEILCGVIFRNKISYYEIDKILREHNIGEVWSLIIKNMILPRHHERPTLNAISNILHALIHEDKYVMRKLYTIDEKSAAYPKNIIDIYTKDKNLGICLVRSMDPKNPPFFIKNLLDVSLLAKITGWDKF